MKELIVNDKLRPYRVFINVNMDKFINTLSENKIKKNEKMFIITDENVYKCFKSHFENLKEHYKVFIYILESGEDNKNINSIIKIYDFLQKKGCNKNSVILAYGGKSVGDISGFAASTYMYGIRFINIPTTFLSQVDSCIGGKTGFNFNETKNLIGSYCNPIFVFISTGFLKKLTRQSFTDGFGEVIKYGVIKDATLLKFLSENSTPILEMENDKLLHIIHESLRLKAQIVEENSKEIGTLNALDFGHTVGHAIEICSCNAVTRGNAVALGILFAIKLSEQVMHIDPELYFKIEKLIVRLGLFVKYKIKDYDLFLSAIKSDMKMINGINFVLLEKLNQCKIKMAINDKMIIDVLKSSISREE